MRIKCLRIKKSFGAFYAETAVQEVLLLLLCYETDLFNSSRRAVSNKYSCKLLYTSIYINLNNCTTDQSIVEFVLKKRVV